MVMDRILKGEEITLYNNGDMHRDWTYVDDIVRGIMAALDKPLGYEIINIGRGEPVRLGDFVDIIQELIGKKARLKVLPLLSVNYRLPMPVLIRPGGCWVMSPRFLFRKGLRRPGNGSKHSRKPPRSQDSLS